MAVSISRFIESKILYLAFAGAGLGVSWWIGGGDIEASRPLPQVATVFAADTQNSRPAKDDLLASLPQQTQSDVSTATVASTPANLPIPTIIRTSSEVATKATSKRYDATRTFESCLPECETRDPLVASPSKVSYAEPSDDSDYDVSEVVVEPRRTIMASIVDGGEDFIANVGAASLGAYRKSESALRVVVDPLR
ncbi:MULTISPECIES: hypothetical protein [unclassified Rhizobium]|uniref:hypothetical protein n=1 Tax=unclassified Rhizobium TaxID=2613769 RepID=UPI000CDF3BF3|nr:MULTISPECIES: hypothetical protein [Rhizobium]AVA22849.1 hypothetical protein NXC24_CH03223 [Rhizobium sp. NXC24]MDK4738154.1 hypothetical protein [Rhizobium sp. CNPSo 3464]UWU20229.1 hypothetical protein N2601_13095 [Rhizobium tropici]